MFLKVILGISFFAGCGLAWGFILGHGSDNASAQEHYDEDNLEEYIACCFHAHIPIF